MMAETATIYELPLGQWECDGCGKSVRAACDCDCGIRYVPPGQRAAEAIKANPTRSDRAIAAEIGVSAPTVSAARRATVKDFTVDEQRIGLDGRTRRLPQRSDAPRDVSGAPLSENWLLDKLRFVLGHVRHLPKHQVIGALNTLIKEVQKWPTTKE